ncbi:cell division protein ZapE [Halomonas sp. YLGW01]|uniref:cell division protein ZapE n=1 Tax=Halomonas sp. YLGW01 TaxID=2773308 RepID=UPI00178299FD|nr:cell division protein ZapE [Halomonas sp. YLGW01]
MTQSSLSRLSPLSPLGAYEHALERGFVEDGAQRRAAEALDACVEALHEAPSQGPGEGDRQGDRVAAGGLYLWGPVGRGKTWLMDRFVASLEVPARRQHFHHFMRWVHRRQFQLMGTADPVGQLAAELADEVRVLCLDELYVNDIADAMLLGGVLMALFEQGVVLVTTSNQAPDQLYADGFNRERFLPAIATLEQHLEVLNLDGGKDHRQHPGEARERYWVVAPGAPSPLPAVFEELVGQQVTTTAPITLGHREIDIERRGEDVLWCRYAMLCEQPLSALDFIGLCDRFRAILLDEVPSLGGEPEAALIARGTEDGVARVAAGDRALPALSPRDDGVRRFIALVDECYDRGIPLYLAARVPLEALYSEGHLAFPFRRSLSRLQEMQLRRFGAEASRR